MRGTEQTLLNWLLWLHGTEEISISVARNSTVNCVSIGVSHRSSDQMELPVIDKSEDYRRPGFAYNSFIVDPPLTLRPPLQFSTLSRITRRRPVIFSGRRQAVMAKLNRTVVEALSSTLVDLGQDWWPIINAASIRAE